MKKKVALGLSGGVDSALSAYFLLEKGYDVTAVYIECWNEPGCRAEQDRKDALNLALKLNIPIKIIDYKKEYKNSVMSYFLEEYKAGRTPNPDVMCNRIIKFGLFYDWAINKNNFDFIATGHYAQIKNIDGSNYLITSPDDKKDQTYFLHTINEEQLNHVLFPIGHLKKEEVRKLAKELKIEVADKKDSVGICFVGDINVKQFLKDNLGEKKGNVILVDGQIIGDHDGHWLYTIGQRHGFRVDAKKYKQAQKKIMKNEDLPSLFILQKNPILNELMVGEKKNVLLDKFEVTNFHFINQNYSNLNFDDNLFVRIRHTGKLYRCSLLNHDLEKFIIQTRDKAEALASGQSAVIYYQNRDVKICLGGGIIA